MPAFTLAYRLRIRNASTLANPNGTADALVLTSVRGGTNPYIVETPEGDGQSVDPLTGECADGSFTVLVADPVTGSDGTGTLRLITNLLEDATLQQQLLSRRAYLELSTDGGGTWPTTLMAGYVNAIKLVDAATWAFTVGDSRRIEQRHRVFTWSNVPGPLGISERTRFPKRGCLVGGPVIGGLLGLPDPGGWEFQVVDSEADPVNSARKYLAIRLIAGYVGPNYSRSRDKVNLLIKLGRATQPFAEPFTLIGGFVGSAFSPLLDTYLWHTYPALEVMITQGGSSWSGTLRGVTFDDARLLMHLDEASSASPPTGNVRLRIVQAQVSPNSPLYLDAHPVDIVTGLYDTVGIGWDATTAAAVKAALGDTLRFTARITEPPIMAEFLSAAIFGPFGFSTRNGSDGEKEFFLTRRIGTAAPSPTLETAHVPEEDLPSIFELEERTIVTAFRIRYRTLVRANSTPQPPDPLPPDGIVEGVVTVLVENADVSVFATREVEYDLPGMVRDASSFSPAMGPLIAAITQEGFNRYGRGAIVGEAVVLRGTSAAAVAVGEELNVDLAHLPSRGYRLGESSVAARIMQVVQRTERPEGAALRLLDSGTDLQPVSPAATITVADAGTSERTMAKFTITNAATINATGVLTTVVEWATGASAPSGNGQLLIRYGPGAVPTGGVALPPVAPGAKVHVRARTEQPFRRSSAWTAWQTHTLTALGAPSSVAAGTLTGESAEVTWTPAAGGFPVDVYLIESASAPGSGTPADWAPYLVATLPAGSSRTILRGLTAATDYTVGVAHRDPSSGHVTTVATDGFTTTANSAQVDPPKAFVHIATSEDASLRTGIAMAVYSANEQHEILIQRAPDSTGSPGTWADLARLQGGSQVYVDLRASDGATWWYRARHEMPGLDPSDWSEDVISATPSGIPDVVPLPPPIPASLEVGAVLSADESEITWAGHNVQLKIDDFGYSTPPTSPFTVERGDLATGDDLYYHFRSRGTLKDEKTMSILVPKKVYVPTGGGSDPSVDLISYADGDTPGDGGGEVEVSWSVSNPPGGATYDLDWSVTAGDPDSFGSGTVVGVTSPFVLNTASAGTQVALGNGARVWTRIRMRSAGATVASKIYEDEVPT